MAERKLAHNLTTNGVSSPVQTARPNLVWQNQRLSVRDDEVTLQDGQHTTFTFIEAAHSVVAIVPIDRGRSVHLVRQWRYPWGRASWEVPAGYLESGETPLEAAQRELREEVGRDAAEWHHLGTVFSSAILRAPFDLYLAKGLSETIVEASRDESEGDLITRAVPLEEAVAAVLDGTIVHAVSALALLRAERLLGS